MITLNQLENEIVSWATRPENLYPGVKKMPAKAKKAEGWQIMANVCDGTQSIMTFQLLGCDMYLKVVEAGGNFSISWMLTQEDFDSVMNAIFF